MNDYIRKAVELADGWSWQELCGTELNILGPNDGLWNSAFPQQMMLDALAAQLVRQVDGLTGCLELIVAEDEVNIWDQANAVFHIKGDDRTMNTIKAIVDSGVLT